MEDMTRKEDMNKKEDKLILGGHEFNSRFILGSGKYNVNLIKAAVEQGMTPPSSSCGPPRMQKSFAWRL